MCDNAEPAWVKTSVPTPRCPKVSSPYSPAMAAGPMLFISGQIALMPDGSGPVRGSFADEARRVLENLKMVLEDAGSSLDNVIKTTVFMADLNQFAEFNAIYAEYFTVNPPARSCVQVARLPLDMQVEVEAIAVLNS